MKQRINHHCLNLGDIPTLTRFDIEVWDDTPNNNEPPHVCLYWGGDQSHVEMTPNEARALAALLIVAAESQEHAAGRKA